MLGIGFIGSGFNTRFHLQALVGVRDVEVRGIYSPTAKNAESAAAMARKLDVGPAKPFKSNPQAVRTTVRCRHRRPAPGRTRRHRVAQSGAPGDVARCRVLQPLSRPHRVRLFFQRDRLSGSRLPRQHVRSGMDRVFTGSIAQARRGIRLRISTETGGSTDRQPSEHQCRRI